MPLASDISVDAWSTEYLYSMWIMLHIHHN